jgi:hypothetical protein
MDDARPPAPRLLVPILVVGLLAGVFVVLAWPATPRHARGPAGESGTHEEAHSVATTSGASRAEAQAAGVLRAWDRQRAAAWAAGDAEALAALYLPGATAGEADVAMLRNWTGRGLAVDRLTTQLLAVRVLARGPRRWVLLVRDRVTGGVAVGAGLSEAITAGAAADREVVLRRVGGAWRVASVRPTPRAAAGRR